MFESNFSYYIVGTIVRFEVRLNRKLVAVALSLHVYKGDRNYYLDSTDQFVCVCSATFMHTRCILIICMHLVTA